MNNKNIVSGLVIGMRKSGTTWVYENLKKSSLVVVSDKVKESGFFSKNNKLKVEGYHDLFPDDDSKIMLEVDTSIIYDLSAAKKIFDYNPDMKILAIKREPKEYVVSRYIHAKRRGLLTEDTIYEALSNQEWFREELKFNKNINRFYSIFPKENICVLDFEELNSSPNTFFQNGFRHLTSKNSDCDPDLEIINPAKVSSFPVITHFISGAARFFRRLGMYSFVNFFKNLGLHKNLENSVKPMELNDEEIDLIQKIVNEDEAKYQI
ncbi:hypothetical protein GCM10009133_35190 [Cocleimonas flava]|uniref:Sulfotransferase domain-containing protein n=1 Tax=Cocleimonas flava TaxID=634765 RepID=A0A4R1F7M9_9GAMM|nr:sulfotransferase domain-containing protein [Cocleimonas flava]TCJ88639.1 sulfotransferase domain-containing protein [Cocleimonas flava]